MFSFLVWTARDTPCFLFLLILLYFLLLHHGTSDALDVFLTILEFFQIIFARSLVGARGAPPKEKVYYGAMVWNSHEAANIIVLLSELLGSRSKNEFLFDS